MTFTFVYNRQEKEGMPCRMSGKGFLHSTQQAVRDRRDQTSLQGSFFGQELAGVDRQSQAVHHACIPSSSSIVFGVW